MKSADSGKVPKESRDTALSHMARRVPTAQGHQTADAVRQSLTGTQWDVVEVISVLDESGRLAGIVGLEELFAAAPDQVVSSLIHEPPVTAKGDADQEEVATRAIGGGRACVPIVDDEGLFLGLVSGRQIVGILRHEHLEDLHRMAGIAHETEHVRETLDSPPPRRVHDRLPWLLVGLGGSFAAALIMARFEKVLEAHVAVAFFVPTIVYLADAISTQTEAVVVRGLSLSRISIGRLFAGEMITGALMGLILGALGFPVVWAALGDARLAAAVSISILVAGAVATGVSVFFPWILTARGYDPAFGAGPVATVVQDVLSIFVYFWLVSLLV